MYKILIFCFLFTSTTSFAQQDDLGSWNVLNVKYTLNDKWSVFAEGQIRSLKFYNNFHYHEYKAGFNYKVNNQLKFSLGAGDYDTYKEGGNFVKPKNNDEFRVWPQITLSQKIGKIKVEQRYRAEMRFTSNGYRSRFRYRLGLAYPFGKEKNGYKPFQASISNELFFTNNEPYFERNRFLYAMNFKPSKTVTLQLGFLNQFDYKINDETGRSFLQMGLFIELYKKKSTKADNEIDLKDN